MRTLKNFCRFAALAVVLLVASAMSSCMAGAGVSGTFDRTFKVDGPVRLELTNGGGSALVTAGAPGEVRVHAEFRVHSWTDGSADRRRSEIEANPPVSQEGNLIRIGGVGISTNNTTIHYTVTTPANTELKGVTGSGGLQVNGIQGPANFIAGSGEISASDIAKDVQAIAGSGSVNLKNIQGQVQATAGSGRVDLEDVRGDIRAQAGSGKLHIVRPGDSVTAGTGSGDIEVSNAASDLRIHTGSGNLLVDGNPESTTFWEFHSSSGNVTLRVSPAASFRLYAKSSSGDINAAIPITMEGTSGKHELRARIGDGKARVEIETSSGRIALQ